MGILAWIVIGALAGWIASRIMHTDAQMHLLANILVGIAGGLLGGLIFNLLGGVGVTGFNLWSLLVSVTGAVILLAIMRAIKRK